jgi:signal transduction histidine kinase
MARPARENRTWILLVGALILAQGAASVFMPRGHALTVVSDLLQSALLVVAAWAILPNASRSRCSSSRTQLFWILMSVGILLWLAYQALWNYFEVIRHAEVPDPFVGDVVLFLHLVPVMAALFLHPHQRHKEEGFRIGIFDFSLLLTWWVFLYIYSVIPWQYVQTSETVYSNNFNQLYLTEKLVLIAFLLFVVFNSEGGWRRLYAQLLGATVLYASGSYLANWAITHNRYYTGSAYDLPLALAMAWMALLGRFAGRYDLRETGNALNSLVGVFITRLAMAALLSLPWFAMHAQLSGTAPSSVKNFRTTLCLITLVVMGVQVFWRQSAAGTELSRLLDESRLSFRNLKALHDQLLQSEKLASLGRLVGGAAHEINNPLTAMLGYSELLNAAPLPPREKSVAGRIAEQVRLTKTLVASLLTFARHTHVTPGPTDLNSVIQTALRLRRDQLEAEGITIQHQLGAGMPPLLADANQLLHVLLHLMTLALEPLADDGRQVLRIQTHLDVGAVAIEIDDNGLKSPRFYSAFNWVEGEMRSSLSLRACCRIVEEHGGHILWQQTAAGRMAFRVALPSESAAANRSLTPGIGSTLRTITGQA